MSKKPPDAVNQFRNRHRKVWKAFNQPEERCHKLALSTGRVAAWSNLPYRLEPA